MISVTTVSNRPQNLRRCVTEVVQQDIPERIEHILVLDGVELDRQLEWELRALTPNLTIQPYPKQTERYLFERVAVLRNVAIRKARGEFIAVLDDDNRWETDHLSTLYQTLCEHPECDAVYSWRTLWTAAGTPYVVDRLYPWVLGGDVGRQELLWQIQMAAGILTPGSNVVRDRYGFEYRGEQVSCVDTGEWLVRRRAFDAISFKEQYTYTEILYGFCDDYLLGREFLRRGVRAVPTQRPTLRYYLGGNSQKYHA